MTKDIFRKITCNLQCENIDYSFSDTEEVLMLNGVDLFKWLDKNVNNYELKVNHMLGVDPSDNSTINMLFAEVNFINDNDAVKFKMIFTDFKLK